MAGHIVPEAGSLAILLSRAGSQPITSDDRSCGRGLTEAAERHGIRMWPVHFANDVELRLRFGTFLTPSNAQPEALIGVGLAPNVLNLPLRPPAVVVRAAASLDLLSGGRVDLGLGAGAVAVAAMGGPRRSPGEAVEALERRSRSSVSSGTPTPAAARGWRESTICSKGPNVVPLPHPIGIWVGAYKPRMLRLTGRPPTAGYRRAPISDPMRCGGERDHRRGGRRGRPEARRCAPALQHQRVLHRIRRLPQWTAAAWVEQLTELAITEGLGTFILGSDDPEMITIFAAEVVPAVREAVADERSRPTSDHDHPITPPARASDPGPGKFTVVPTPDDGNRLGPTSLWDETRRPTGPSPDPGRQYSPAELATGRQLVDIHDHLRAELIRVRDLIQQVLDGSIGPGSARSAINEMTMRQNNWTVGAYCAACCRVVTTHQAIEDQALFPRLRRADPRLGAVVDRLASEHLVIHQVLNSLDRALVGFVSDPPSASQLRRAADELSDRLLSHLSYEERELVEPLARLGVLV
jgi:hypothetical protein